MDRLYCTLTELIDGLDRAGVKAWKENQALEKIQAASDWIDAELGMFIPYTEARRFDGFGGVDLWPGALLAVSSIVDDTAALQEADYILYGQGSGRPNWENGPYHRITLDPDATTIAAWSNEEDIIVINGRWGFYERSISTDATATDQTDNATVLTVSDASKISLGAVLLVEAEQELVEGRGNATDSTATLNGDHDASTEEIVTSDGTQFNSGEVIKIDFEQMMIRDIASDTLLVERGWNGTKKVTHADTTAINIYRKFTVKRGVNGTTAAAHTAPTISRYVAPHQVNYLCRQMATLMLKKEEGAYAGKTGSVELGEVFYMDEFPRGVIDEIKRHYFIPVT